MQHRFRVLMMSTLCRICGLTQGALPIQVVRPLLQPEEKGPPVARRHRTGSSVSVVEVRRPPPPNGSLR